VPPATLWFTNEQLSFAFQQFHATIRASQVALFVYGVREPSSRFYHLNSSDH
jgi:hypothetical protein